MSGAWGAAVPPFLVAAAALVLPGLAVILAGFGARRIGLLFAAPAVSAALLAISAVVAPWIGLDWSLVPVLMLTAIASVAAYFLRRWVGREEIPRPGVLAIVAAAIGFAAAAVIMWAQLTYVFVAPASISQTFDAIIHLNTVAFAVDTGNASAFHIGATSDIPFYPNAWHSVAALTAQATGVPVAVAVNAANIAIGAIAWPASTIALASALFGDRGVAFVAAAALSTGFGAFPILLFSFGVLYPNTMAYAILPAGLAAVWWLWRARGLASRIRAGVLLVVVCAGIGLGHPNAFLALYALGAFVLLWEVIRAGLARNDRRAWITYGSIAGALLLGGVIIWGFSRTAFEMSRWGPWQSTAQAVGEALLLAPRQYPITVIVSILVLTGLIAAVRRPRLLVFAIPFAVAAFMFVLASGTGVGNFVREAVTNPWYNDPYRLAALLPIAGIPVATLGAITITDAAASLIQLRRIPHGVAVTAAVVAALAVFTVGVGPNVVRTAADARGSYTFTDSSALLTADEAALLARLPGETPSDALIAGNPWTGTSLAYALAGRQVVEKHVFGIRTEDELYLDANLRDIDEDPRVCEAVRSLGVTHALDFGSQNVFNSPASGLDHLGLNDLSPSDHLVLVDSEGAGARLFKIEGC
ncbi:DUF6541 family protein [Microbacterium trichothecenolyticum]|uniref:DUF6541 family protein n=1 Tax=Microbacterium trichothecenolyticum TaxID=69370 RepID=UPI0035BE2914